MRDYEGSCACGNIAYSFEGEPINTAFCYCEECQKHTGSDKWFGLWVPLDNLSFTRGTPSIFIRLGDSGKEMKHKFCSECGVTVCVEVEVANIFSVPASSLTTANDFKPNMCIYTASAAEWAVFPDGIPQFEALPPM